MKNLTNDTYTINDSVIVVNKDHPYHTKRGNIIRFGEAGDVKYVIVRLDGVHTLITFNESDLRNG